MTDKQRLLSLSLKWSVCFVLCKSSKKAIKTPNSNKRTPLLNQLQQGEEAERGLIVYKARFQLLLTSPKNLRDQLIIEGPCLNALRTGEVSSLRVEYLHFDSGDFEILDSKSLLLCTRPLDPTFAKHLDQYLNGRREGIVIQPLPGAPHVGRKPGSKTLGAGLSIKHIEYLWEKYCKHLGFPRMPPRMGRAYFACYEHFTLGKPIGYIKFMLRHDDLQSTEHYLYEQIVSYEDQKAIFYRGKASPFADSECANMKCLGREVGCRCRMFQSMQAEVETKT